MANIQEKGFSGKFLNIIRRYFAITLHNLDNLHLLIAMLTFGIALSIRALITVDLTQFRACTLQLGWNESYCQGSGRQTTEVQDIVAGIHIWESVLQNLFPILYVLFLGSWSDRYGRKPLVALAIFGTAVSFTSLLIVIYFKNASAAMVTLVSVLPRSLTGGDVASTMAIALYIADTTPPESRTVVITSFTALNAVGISVGYLLAGQLKESYADNYTLIVGIGGGFNLFAFAYTMFVVRHVRQKATVKNQNVQKSLIAAFDLSNVKDSLVTFFKKRDGGRRAQLISIALMLVLMNASANGETGTFQNFATSKQIGFTTSEYSYFYICQVVLFVVASLGAMTVLVNVFKMEDATLGILSSISNIAGAFVFAFANSKAMLYSAPFVDFLAGVSFTVFRSMATKIAPNDELGKIFTVISIGDTCTTLAFGTMYAAVYKVTLEEFPGCFLLVSAVVTIPVLIICCRLRCYLQKDINSLTANLTLGTEVSNMEISTTVIKNPLQHKASIAV